MNDLSYTNWYSMSDAALLGTIGDFVQHHRLGQNKSQAEVAKAAGVSRSTLSLLERGEKITISSLIQVLRALELLHIMDFFKVNFEISPVEYAKLQKNKRQRSRNKNTNSKEDIGW